MCASMREKVSILIGSIFFKKQKLRDMIIDDDVAPFKEDDAFLSNGKPIPKKEEKSVLISECVVPISNNDYCTDKVVIVLRQAS